MSSDDDAGAPRRQKNGQFMRGVSGNPNGRPPNRRRLEGPGQFARDAIALAGQVVELNGANGPRKITRGELMLEAIYANAIKGKAASQKLLLGLLKEGYAERLHQHPILEVAEVLRQLYEDPNGTHDRAFLSAVDEWARRLKKL